MNLLKNNKILFSYFDHDKNDIDLDSLTTGSRTVVFWKCKNNHSFERKMGEFKKSQACPKCRKEKNPLSKNKKLMEEWDYKKNKNLNPNEINQSNNRLKVFWICKECSHSWDARVYSRTKKHSGCPKCASTKQHSKNEMRLYAELNSLFNDVVSNYNLSGFSYDIFIKDLNLLIEYDGFQWHKNRYEHDHKKNEIAKSHGFKLIRLREQGLKEISSSDILIPFDFNIKRDFETQKKLVDLLLLKMNKLSLIKDFSIFKIYIKQTSFNNIEEYNLYENKIKHKETVSDSPILLKEWDFDKNNNISPENVSLKTSTLYWWKCEKGEDHSWESSPLNRQIRKCPFCSNKKISITNRFDLNEPELLRLWNYKKNTKRPEDYTNRNSVDSIHWTCKHCLSPIVKNIRNMVDNRGFCQSCRCYNKY